MNTAVQGWCTVVFYIRMDEHGMKYYQAEYAKIQGEKRHNTVRYAFPGIVERVTVNIVNGSML